MASNPALQAATISFNTSAKFPAKLHAATGSESKSIGQDARGAELPLLDAAKKDIPLLAAQRTWERRTGSSLSHRYHLPPPGSRSLSEMGTEYARRKRVDDKDNGDEGVFPTKGSVEEAKKRLLLAQEELEGGRRGGARGLDYGNSGNRPVTPEQNNMKAVLVDQSPIEDLSSLVNKFGGAKKTLQSPKPDATVLVASKVSKANPSPGSDGYLPTATKITRQLPSLSFSSSRTPFQTDGGDRWPPSPLSRPDALLETSQAIEALPRDSNPTKKQAAPQAPPPRRAKTVRGERNKSIDTSLQPRQVIQDKEMINDAKVSLVQSWGDGGPCSLHYYPSIKETLISTMSSPRQTTSTTTTTTSNTNINTALQAALQSTKKTPSVPKFVVSTNSMNGVGSINVSPNKTGESIASYHAHAVIASSLATSREPTPIPPAHPFTLTVPKQDNKGKKPLPPPPPPSRMIRRRSLPAMGASTTFLPTLRNTKKLEIEHKKSSSGKPPRITPKQRKRYEGVWAANRGLLLPQGCDDLVEGIIVRDIFSRSRLGFEQLAEIWELVDRGKKGKLDREEFVIGMWLVDRCLEGRKVPMKVAEYIWRDI